MKYKKVLLQFLKQCRQFDFYELLENYDGCDVVVNEIEPSIFECTYDCTDIDDEIHVTIKVSERKEVIFAQCDCDDEISTSNNSSPYCPHIIGAYLAILERFNPHINLFEYVEENIDTIEWKENIHQTYTTLFGELDLDAPNSIHPMLSPEEMNEISMYDLFHDMDREDILNFLENITTAFPPLKDLLVQASMLASLIEGDDLEEFEEMGRTKKKKDMLS